MQLLFLKVKLMRYLQFGWAKYLLLSVFLGHAVCAAEFPSVQITTLKTDIRSPWGMTQLPNDSWLITEKAGSILQLTSDGEATYVGDIPADLFVAGQGGMLDITLHPNYDDNNWVYISYAAGTASANQLVVSRARFQGDKLSTWESVFRVLPLKDTPVHYAGRLQFLDDNSLLITSGDGFDYREDAQKLSSLLGKVIRIRDDGSAPSDNPFYLGNGDNQDFIFTLGHRNQQGLAYDSAEKRIILHEHGPAGGDEINFLDAGVNYGWPVVTGGKDYSGANISPFSDYEGMQLPAFNWTPSIAPSAMAYYNSDLFPSLKGDLLIPALKTRRLYWAQIEGAEVISVQPIVESLQQRLREIHIGNDGAIYILTDGENASLLKMSPSK